MMEPWIWMVGGILGVCLFVLIMLGIISIKISWDDYRYRKSLKEYRKKRYL